MSRTFPRHCSGPLRWLCRLPQDGFGFHSQNVLEADIDFQYKPNTLVYPRLRPDKTALDSARKILQEAKRPVLLVESGVERCGALDEVVRFAELTGSRVYQSWMFRRKLPVTHPQYSVIWIRPAPPPEAFSRRWMC